VLDGKFDPPATHLPARIRRALSRGIDASPDRRFASMAALLAELERARSNRRTLWLAAAGVLVAAAGLAIVLALDRSESPERASLRVLRTTQLTREADLQLDPAASPDGLRVAYASGQLGHMQIYVRPIAGGPAVALTGELAGDQRWPQWSPDGSEVLFQVAEAGFESRYRVYVVPATGGTPRVRIAPPGKSAAMAAWSPDGRSIAYVQFDQSWNPPWEIVVVDADGRNPHPAYSTERNATLSTPSWSPDGSHLAFSYGNASFWLRGNIAPASIWVVPARGGPTVQVTTGQSLDHAPVWTRDGRSLLFVSDRDGTPDVYRIAVQSDGTPAGAPERLTAGLHAHTVAISSDHRLVCSVFTYRTNLWSVAIPRGDTEGSLADARPVTSGNQIVESVDPSPDGAWLAFDSNRSGNQDLYIVPATGGDPVAVTRDPANDFAPAWSPDGTKLAFHSFRTGTRNVFVIDRDGKTTTQITHGNFNHWNPRWSPDGRTLAFYSDRAGEWSAWTAPAIGGELHRITHLKSMAPRWSHDGRTLTFTNNDGLWSVPVTGGEPTRLVDAPEITNHNYSADGSIIYYRRSHQGGGSMWAVPAAGGTPHRVLRLEDPVRHPDRVEFGVDDHRFLIPLTEHDADVWLLELGP